MKGEELMNILRKLKQKDWLSVRSLMAKVQWRLTKAGLARGGDIDALAEEIMYEEL